VQLVTRGTQRSILHSAAAVTAENAVGHHWDAGVVVSHPKATVVTERAVGNYCIAAIVVQTLPDVSIECAFG
jgi:hypothetical protein